MLLVASGVQFLRTRASGFWIYAAMFVGTVIWSIHEIGFDFWMSVPRLAPVLGLFALLVLPSISHGRLRLASRAGAVAMGLVIVAGGVTMFVPHNLVNGVATAAPGDLPAAEGESRWQYYGRTPGGTRYAPLAQITKDNVDQLEVGWTFRTGDIASRGLENQNTPTQIGDTLYICTTRNKVFTLDADPRRAEVDVRSACRQQVLEPLPGCGFLRAGCGDHTGGRWSGPLPAPDGACSQRTVLATMDARLIQLDARTGKLCAGFGNGGTVNLKPGMGSFKPIYYFQTSTPTVMRNLVILGGFVADGREVDEPSGVGARLQCRHR